MHLVFMYLVPQCFCAIFVQGMVQYFKHFLLIIGLLKLFILYVFILHKVYQFNNLFTRTMARSGFPCMQCMFTQQISMANLSEILDNLIGLGEYRPRYLKSCQARVCTQLLHTHSHHSRTHHIICVHTTCAHTTCGHTSYAHTHTPHAHAHTTHAHTTSANATCAHSRHIHTTRAHTTHIHTHDTHHTHAHHTRTTHIYITYTHYTMHRIHALHIHTMCTLHAQHTHTHFTHTHATHTHTHTHTYLNSPIYTITCSCQQVYIGSPVSIGFIRVHKFVCSRWSHTTLCVFL